MIDNYECKMNRKGIMYNCARNKSPNFTVFPFYKFLRDTTEKEREAKEKLFIYKYRPVLNA